MSRRTCLVLPKPLVEIKDILGMHGKETSIDNVVSTMIFKICYTMGLGPVWPVL